MALPLPPGRNDSRRQGVAVQQQQRGGGGAGNANNGNRKRGSVGMMRAVNSCRSVAVSDAILAAQSTFEGGEFQPEAFPRCVCLLLEAFEGGDNAIKLSAARLLERCRPYFGGNVLAVEVAQRVSQVLGYHDDPTTRELCLDVLSAVTFGTGGLPRGILLDIGRSLRSPFLAERRAAARAYASCMCAHRSSPSPPPPPPPPASSSLGSGGPPPSPPGLTPRTLEEMSALSSALLPLLSCERGDARVSGWRGGGGGREGGGFSPRGVEELLEAVLWKVSGDLPSTELWESLKVFLLDEDTSTSSSSSSPPETQLNVTALVDLVLHRLRSNSSASGQASAAAAAAAAPGASNPALRAMAVDFFVSLIHVEAVERSKFAMAAAEAAVEAAAVAEREEQARKQEAQDEPRKKEDATSGGGGGGGGASASASAAKAAPRATPPTPGRSSVWRLLDAVSAASEAHGEKAELLSVLGAPAVAVAVLEAEAVAGAKSAGKMAAAHGFGDAAGGGGGSGGGGNGGSGGGRVGEEAHALARIRFPLATAAVEAFRRLCTSPPPSPTTSPSLSSTLSSSSVLLLACASSLVSYSVAAFRETPFYPADGGISDSAARRDKALAALAEFAADGVLSSLPVLRLLSSRGISGGGPAAAAGARLLLPQLRALAAVHAWPRQRVALAVARSLRRVPPTSALAVELAVLVSHVVRAGEGDDKGSGGGGGGAGAGGERLGDLERVLWELLFGRRFCDDNPKAAVGIAVALMRHHRGSLSRQSTLSSALVGAMGGGGGGGGGGLASDNDAGSPSSAAASGGEDDPGTAAAGSGGAEAGKRCPAEPEGTDPIVLDPWFQLVLCRECMLHGFFEAAGAGLRRLRDGGRRKGGGAVLPASDTVWAWTEVLGKVSAAEAFFGGSPDPVAAHACAAHETALAAELLASIPRRPAGPWGNGRRSPSVQPQSVPAAAAGQGGEGGVAGVFRGGGGGDLFAFQRGFLLARAELLRLLGACWGMCQDLSATRTNRYARNSRREARCRRLPAAFRRLARDFRLLRGFAPGAGSTTSEPLRAASCLCLFLAIAADALLSQGKSVFVGSREKGSNKKKTWRGWLERLVAAGAEEEEEDRVGGGETEGALLKAVRLLGSRLLGLSDPPKASIGRVAFSSILESVRGTPFPIPRAFFRTGVSPRVALSALPPAPAASLTGPDGVAADGTGSAPWGGQPPPPPHQQAFDDFPPPLSSSPVAMAATADEPSGGGGGMSVGEKRQRRDGGAGARYYGPSCRLRADVAEAERSRRPRLPLISAAPAVSTAAGSSPPLSHSSRCPNSGGGGPRRNPSSLSFSASEAWWAQLVREEVMLAAAAAATPSGQAGVGAGGIWRSHAVGQTGGAGVWLLQGTVCRGRGTGGVLPAVSEVVLKISVELPPAAVASGGGADSLRSQGDPKRGISAATRKWSKEVVAEMFGAPADSSTVLCFRAQVHLPAFSPPSLPTARNGGGAANSPASGGGGGGGGSAGVGGVMEVTVCLRSRGKQQHDERANDTGFVALGSSSRGGADAHGSGGGGNGEKEVWTVGKVAVPLPPTPTW